MTKTEIKVECPVCSHPITMTVATPRFLNPVVARTECKGIGSCGTKLTLKLTLAKNQHAQRGAIAYDFVDAELSPIAEKMVALHDANRKKLYRPGADNAGT